MAERMTNQRLDELCVEYAGLRLPQNVDDLMYTFILELRAERQRANEEKERAACRMLREWHTTFSVPIQDSPRFPGADRARLRVKLIDEEAEEFAKASNEGNVIEAADALADLLYVVYGAALEWGIPLDAVFDEVHRSNMTKVWPDGTVHYREDGKVLKPPTYSPADVDAVLVRLWAAADLARLGTR